MSNQVEKTLPETDKEVIKRARGFPIHQIQQKTQQSRRAKSLDTSLFLRRLTSDSEFSDSDSEFQKFETTPNGTRPRPFSEVSPLSNWSNLVANPMNPLDFEVIDLKNTPLSSLRSCSEFNKTNDNLNQQKIETINNKNNKSIFNYIFGSWSLKKSKKKRVDTSKLDSEEQLYLYEQLRSKPSMDENDSNSIISNNYAMSKLSFSESVLSRDSCISIEEEQMRHHTNYNSHNSYYYNSNNYRNTSRRNHYQLKNKSLITESSYALDLLFGFTFHKEKPSKAMEIELQEFDPLLSGRGKRAMKTLTMTNNPAFSRMSSHNNAFPRMSSHNNAFPRMSSHNNAFPRMSSHNSAFSRMLSNNSAYSNNNDLDDLEVGSIHSPRPSLTRLEELNLIPSSSSTTNLELLNTNNVINQHQITIQEIQSNYQYYSEIINNKYFYCIEILSKLSQNYILINANDEFFYETIRIQPFSSGTYLRGMLLAGFTSFFFNLYSLTLWPIIIFQKQLLCYELILYIILMLQVLLNLIQLPLRLRIHYYCWESCRSVEVETAVEILRGLIHSDEWIVNRGLGRMIDILSVLSLLLGEIYLWITPIYDNYRVLFISISATNLLSFNECLVLNCNACV